MKDLIKKLLYLLPKGDVFKISALFLLMLIAAGLEVVGIGMIPVFVAIVASPEKVMEQDLLGPVLTWLSIENSQDLLIWGGVLLIAVYIIKNIYVTLFNYIEAKFIYNRRYTLSHRLMSAYMMAPYPFHLQRNSAELLRNVIREIEIVVTVLTDLLKIAREGLMAVAILAMLIFVEPIITIVVILLSGIGAGGFLMLTQKKVKHYGLQDQGHRRNMLQAVNQGLGGIKDARLLNREKEFIEKFRIEAYLSTRLKTYIRFIKQIPKPVVEITAVLGMMMIAGIMVWQGRPMAAIIPILTLFAMSIVKLMPAVHQLSTLFTGISYNIVAVDPVYDDLKELEEDIGILKLDRKRKLKFVFENRIQAKHLEYTYPNADTRALREVSFSIPKGGVVAFVGESGAGKSTLVDLILGLLKPDGGQIMADGENIFENLSAWQRTIGYIPQAIYMADDTLRNNIAFGVPKNEIDDDDIWEAVELAQLKDLIESIPSGLDTIIGEHGTRLSGGQRQRVGIARALYHKPQMLVMDEATSALDNITEKQITNAIEQLKGDRTIIMIAHRLSTVENCDKLYLMKDGCISDEGTYSELAKNNKEFRKMALIS